MDTQYHTARKSASKEPLRPHSGLTSIVRISVLVGLLISVPIPSNILAQPLQSKPLDATPKEPAASAPPSQSATDTSVQEVKIEELELLKEEESDPRMEESVSIGSGIFPGTPKPISKSPSNVYIITDDDIRQSGAIDIPTVLRSVPGIEVMQVTGADMNVSARGNNQLRANKMLVLVDGRSIFLDVQRRTPLEKHSSDLAGNQAD